MLLLDKLESLSNKYNELQVQLNTPEITSDIKKLIKLNKDIKELEPVITAYKEYTNVIANIESSKELFQTEKDEDMRAMAREEINTLTEKKAIMEDEFQILLLPNDPQDRKNAILEIRAGTGGDEASIFAGDLHRMYIKYCESRGWQIEPVSATYGTVGGYKEVIFNVKGENVYGQLKYESGVHRVQRVPQTETQGRVHTSAASVVVLPEADEFDIELKMSDIRKDTYCSSGPGGQSVNTTYSAIRLTHVPTGIIVTCQDQKSQIKNYEKALEVLRARLFEIEYKKYLDDISGKRKTMVSTGDRSAKIRTYNYPQGRVTDHRINYSSFNLTSIMDGSIQEFIDELQIAENAERLKASLEEDKN